jgi:hypothetical protein
LAMRRLLGGSSDHTSMTVQIIEREEEEWSSTRRHFVGLADNDNQNRRYYVTPQRVLELIWGGEGRNMRTIVLKEEAGGNLRCGGVIARPRTLIVPWSAISVEPPANAVRKDR